MNHFCFEHVIWINGQPLVQYSTHYIDDNRTAQQLLEEVEEELNLNGGNK